MAGSRALGYRVAWVHRAGAPTERLGCLPDAYRSRLAPPIHFRPPLMQIRDQDGGNDVAKVNAIRQLELMRVAEDDPNRSIGDRAITNQA